LLSGYCQHDDSVPDWTEHIFMTADFEKAARLVWRQITQPSSHILFDNEEGSENDMVIIPPGTTKLVAALLPADRTEFEYMKANVHSKDDLAEFLAVYKGLNTKTVQDIREHGMCLERMKPGKSTIKGAGQGGFAQYKIHKDEMIVPAPVLHIMDKDALALHDDHGDTIGTQLLINYCLSHPDSTVLLCPDTNALLINHCSTRMKEWQQYCPNGPNAIHRWSSGWDATSDIWKNMTLDLLSIQTARGLALEIIATRDIEVGEEVRAFELIIDTFRRRHSHFSPCFHCFNRFRSLWTMEKSGNWHGNTMLPRGNRHRRLMRLGSPPWRRMINPRHR
jgi:hypothetical protein